MFDLLFCYWLWQASCYKDECFQFLVTPLLCIWANFHKWFHDQKIFWTEWSGLFLVGVLCCSSCFLLFNRLLLIEQSTCWMFGLLWFRDDAAAFVCSILGSASVSNSDLLPLLVDNTLEARNSLSNDAEFMDIQRVKWSCIQSLISCESGLVGCDSLLVWMNKILVALKLVVWQECSAQTNWSGWVWVGLGGKRCFLHKAKIMIFWWKFFCYKEWLPDPTLANGLRRAVNFFSMDFYPGRILKSS